MLELLYFFCYRCRSSLNLLDIDKHICGDAEIKIKVDQENLSLLFRNIVHFVYTDLCLELENVTKDHINPPRLTIDGYSSNNIYIFNRKFDIHN